MSLFEHSSELKSVYTKAILMHTFHFIYLGSLHYYDNVNQCRCCHQIIVIMVDLSIFYYYMEMNEKNRNNALFM